MGGYLSKDLLDMELEKDGGDHKLLIEILSGLSSLKSRLDFIGESNTKLSNRLETVEKELSGQIGDVEKELSGRIYELEKSYNKTMGAMQLAVVVTSVAVGILTLTANLWVDQKIRDYDNQHTPKIESQKFYDKQKPK